MSCDEHTQKAKQAVESNGAVAPAVISQTRASKVGDQTRQNPLPKSKRRYKTAKSAFQAALRRQIGDDESRATVCENPEYAFRYALEIDKSPREETRRGACADPQFAYKYAKQIDKSPQEVTRLAACARAWCALLYAQCVDGSPRDETRLAACGDSWRAFMYAKYVDKSFHPITLLAVKKSGSFFIEYLQWFQKDRQDLEIRILLDEPYEVEELLDRPDLIMKYGMPD